MKPRLQFKEVDPEGFRAFLYLQRYVDACGLEPSLLDLIRLRASQIEGCAYCIDAHNKDAQARGESEQRLYALSAWRSSPFYTDRERAALAWTEALTLLSENSIPDELYESVRSQFSEKELVDLTYAVIHIKGWNLLANSFRLVPGSYNLQAVKLAKEQAS
jgi:AhpD family alkylhydroperoxidase